MEKLENIKQYDSLMAAPNIIPINPSSQFTSESQKRKRTTPNDS